MTGLPQSGRIECLVDLNNCLLGFHEAGDPSDEPELADDEGGLEGMRSRSGDEKIGVAVVLEVVADDFEVGREGVEELIIRVQRVSSTKSPDGRRGCFVA